MFSLSFYMAYRGNEEFDEDDVDENGVINDVDDDSDVRANFNHNHELTIS